MQAKKADWITLPYPKNIYMGSGGGGGGSGRKKETAAYANS